jgi:tetratricopeptide (TPR) repeat protein
MAVVGLAAGGRPSAAGAQQPVVLGGQLAADPRLVVRLTDSIRVRAAERHARPDDLAGSLALADLLARRGDRLAALSLYDTLLRAPAPPPAVFGAAARFWFVNGRADSAAFVLERGLGRYPESAPLWGLLGDSRAHSRQWIAAATAYRRAASLIARPDSVELALIDALTAGGDTAAALDVVRSMRRRPRTTARASLAMLGAAQRALLLGRRGVLEADSVYRSLIARDAGDVNALEGRARTALALGDTVATLDASRRALADERSSATSALVLLRIGRPGQDSARALLRAAAWHAASTVERIDAGAMRGARPTDDPVAANRVLREVLDTMVFHTAWGAGELDALRAAYPQSGLLRLYAARVAFDGGRTTDALQLYDVAVSREPANVDAQLGRARALLRLGREREALSAAERALDLEPERQDVFRLRLQMAEQAGGAEMERLLAQIRRLRERLPKSRVLAEHEVELLQRLGRLDEAAGVARAANIAPPPPPRQTGIDTTSQLWRIAHDRFSGEAVATSESYTQQGGTDRQPGETWSLTLDPHLQVVGGIAVGLDVRLSSDGSQLRQNINQLGINPRWSWGTAHLGDFNDSYSQYTTQGLRVRGAGLDLTPGALRFSVQGGETQRAVAGGVAAGAVYSRAMIATKLGVGHDDGSYLDLEVVKVKDDLNSVNQSLVVADTIALDSLVNDTIPAAFRLHPQSDTHAQENFVSALVGQLSLFQRALRVKGEFAGSIITADETTPLANRSAIGGLRLLSGVMPVRLSTSGDVAYNVESELTLPAAGLRAGYSYVGPGYTSLGLGYVMNDQRQYMVGGNTTLAAGLVALQGQYEHQNDNLLGQKLSTTNRDVVSGTLAVKAGGSLTTSFTGSLSDVGNNSPVDTFAVSNQALSLTTSLALTHPLHGLPEVSMLTYGYQAVNDATGVTPAPRVVVHTVSFSEQVTAAHGVSVAPTLSGVVTQTAGQPDQRNLFVGFRGQGKFMDGRLRPMASVSQSFTNGRRVFAARTEVSYALPTDARLVFATRYNSYGPYGTNPAFQESFLTTTLARSF